MVTVSLETLVTRSKRNMAKGTKEKVKTNALEMIKRAYKEGIYVQITEGFRSNARQNELYAQGRTKSGNIVTNAKAGQSNHNYGIAVDYVLVSSDGKTANWTVNKDWRRVAEIGKSLGFQWGGDWTSFKDYPHLEMKELKGSSGGSSKPTKPTTNKGGRFLEKLNVDGIRGAKTIKRLQQFVGTPVDGKLDKKSPATKAWQQFLNKYGGAKISADGIEGPKTIKAGQKFFGTTADGKISKTSPFIKELQKFLNNYGR